jgi:hypothetical protein
VTESGGITYRNEDINDSERIDAKDKVYEIVRTTAEYMRQMETAPFLKADGLEDGYKVLADFNGTVLAGHPEQPRCPVRHLGLELWTTRAYAHGHYTDYIVRATTKEPNSDFAVRSGLISEQAVLS